MSFPSWPYRISRRGSLAPCHRPLLLRAAPLHPSPCARRPGSQRPPRGLRLWIELVYERRRNPLDYLDLLGGQVLLPAAGLGLAVELALALLLLWYVLPGVLLDRARKPGLLHGDLQGRVDAPHRAQCVRPQVLVADHHLAAPVRLVGLLGVSHVPYVPFGLALHEGIWPALGQRRRLLLAALPHQVGGPGSLLVGVEVGSDDVPRVADEQDHTALGNGLHEQRSPHRALRLLYDQVPPAFACYLGETRGGRVEDEPPHRVQPELLVAGPENEVLVLAAVT